MSTEDLQFINNTLTTFIYEPFSYTISNPGPYTLTISNTPGIPPGYLTSNATEVIFSTSSNGMNVGKEVFVVTASLGTTVVATSSNTVNVNAGRFLDADGNSYTGRTFPFFKNEPITPLTLDAPFAIATPTTVPTLPPGLTYTSNASNSFSITGTPLVTVPQSNYLAIGKATGLNLGKIVTSQFGLSVSNERVIVDLAGPSIVSPMIVGTAIAPRTITSRFPPYPSGGTLRYTFNGIPDGIRVTDVSGNTKTSPFTPDDLSNTLILQGTPSLAAANAYRDAETPSKTVTFLATRTNPLPVISNSTAITFAFGETVLFDSVTVPPLYSGVTLDPSATFFRAQTYFVNTGSDISAIFSPDLRSDLSINFVPAQRRGYLTGTPITTGTTEYTIRAINSNLITRDISVPITVEADSVTFESPPTPAVDVCYNFVLSRPSSLPLTGYYPSNIQFQATAASKKPVNFSAPALVGTGLSLSNVSANVVQLVGTPDTVTPLTTVTITADASGTPATASRTFKLAVVNDQITIADVCANLLSFTQNREITPVQLSATTLSERPVLSFTSANLPSGITLSPNGLLTGTPTPTSVTSNFTVNASTGFASQDTSFSFTYIPDSILFFVKIGDTTSNSASYIVNGSNGDGQVSIEISGLSYGGNLISNYAFSNFTPSYGLSIDSSTGIISGTFVNESPNFLPPSSNFFVNAQAGNLVDSLPVNLSTTNPTVFRSILTFNYTYPEPPSYDDISFSSIGTLRPGDTQMYTYDYGSNIGGSNSSICDFQIKNTSIDSNVFLASIHAQGSLFRITRSTDGIFFSNVSLPVNYPSNTQLSSLANEVGTSTWWLAAWQPAQMVEESVLYLIPSFDDGETWTTNIQYIADIKPRNNDQVTSSVYLNAIALRISTGNLFLAGGLTRYATSGGGGSMIRSDTFGQTWTIIPTGFINETANFALDASSMWIATGSDRYISEGGLDNFMDPTSTIKYSVDEGVTWADATGAFNMFGYDVTYASNTWVATGITGTSGGISNPNTYKVEVRFSTNGSNWALADLSTGYILVDVCGQQVDSAPRIPPLPVSPPMFDGSNWNIFVYNPNLAGTGVKVYRHDNVSSLSTGWTSQDFSEPGGSNNIFRDFSSVRILNPKPPLFFPSDSGPTIATLTFTTSPPGGPTITSPTNTSFTFYQYAPVSPITFTATGTGIIYYFIQTATLPIGITFDPITATLSGTSVELGKRTFIVYAKDDIGVTEILVSTNTILPIVTRQQTSAGAWTSLIRQYTLVNAAQNSLNGKVLPANELTLGEFTRPQPPDSVSATGDPNCEKKC